VEAAFFMQQSDRAGLAYVFAGFSTLSIGDAIVKSMAGLWPAPAMAATRYILAALVLSAVLARSSGWSAVWRMPRARLQWVRGLAVSVATMAMFSALWLMPLADATTITFTQPMITALLATMFLGERLRPAALGATLVGFVGVVLVLRPNFVEIGLPALLPLVAAASMAVLMIANRASAGAGTALVMQTYVSITASVVLAVATVAGHFSGIVELEMHWPAWHVFARCAFIAFSATVAHWLIYLGTEKAGAATVAPMTYGQLLGAALLGWLFFGETPDAMALLGAAIIIGAGLYLWRINRMREPAETVP
jgi:drug/metabolite transporter (DMT)-like permease